jgi:hypothetical protein
LKRFYNIVSYILSSYSLMSEVLVSKRKRQIISVAQPTGLTQPTGLLTQQTQLNPSIKLGTFPQTPKQTPFSNAATVFPYPFVLDSKQQ